MYQQLLRILFVLTLFNLPINLYSQAWTKIELEYDYITTIYQARDDASKIYIGLNAFETDFSPQKINFNSFGQGIIVSSDSGKTWSEAVLDGFTVLDIIQSSNDNNIWYASIVKLLRGGVLKSIDGGKNWDEENILCDASYQINKFAGTEDIEELFFGAAVNTSEGLISTNDDFKRCLANKELNIQARTVAVSKIDPEFIFVAGDAFYDSGVFISSDKGKTWVKNESGLENKRVLSLLASSNRVGLLYAGCDSVDQFKRIHGKGIYRSEDTGRTWKLAAAEGAIVWDIREHPRYSKFIAAACGTMGVMVSANHGAYWEQYKSGLPSEKQANRILIPDWDTSAVGFTAFAAVHGEGLFISGGLNTSVEADVSNLFSNVSIAPNPFSDEITILSSSAQADLVHIRVFDIMGNLIFESENLIYSSKNNPVTLRIGDKLNVGAYFISLNGQFIKARKIIFKSE